ncbi:MAG: hypothetical protein EA340_01570 [Nitriliruptor sp.]|nr:MAG: hypothetical protein EA340_01570 [Nitriliruptor sp.]
MGRAVESSFETTMKLRHLRQQVDQLERRVAQLESRVGYPGPGHVHGSPMEEFPDGVRAIVRQQSVILAASTIMSAILIFIIVRLAT